MKISLTPLDKLFVTEKQFSQQIVDLARLLGWKVYRTWNSIHSPAGYPDLCLVRLSRLVYAELKSDKGKVLLAQQEWLDALTTTGKCEVYIWRPCDFDNIIELLK